MRIEDIRGKLPQELYRLIDTNSFTDSVEFGIKFRDVLNDFTEEEQKQYREKWCHAFIKCAIDEITMMHKRNNEISEDEKDYFAKNFLRKYKDYTLADIKLFANMVCSCEIGEGLKAVDIAAINEKLVNYNQMRNNYLSDYYAQTDKQSYSGVASEFSADDFEVQYALLKMRLKAYGAVKDEFMKYAENYYKSIGLKYEGILRPSRIPNFIQAIQEYLDEHPNRFWLEYKEALNDNSIIPRGVQTEMNLLDTF